jgi:peptidoglycan hydrolase CwlO-like protein
LVVVPFVGHHELSVDLSLQEGRCSLYEFNDPELSDFQKKAVKRLREKIRSLEAQVVHMKGELLEKDSELKELKGKLELKELKGKLELKELKGKLLELKEKEDEVKMTCRFHKAVAVAICFIVIAWWCNLFK